MKALELADSKILSLSQPAHRGCAGIGRQLHPLKAEDLMKEDVIKIKPKNDMRG